MCHMKSSLLLLGSHILHEKHPFPLMLSLSLCSFEHVAWSRHRSYELVRGTDDEVITFKSMSPVAKLQVYYYISFVCQMI